MSLRGHGFLGGLAFSGFVVVFFVASCGKVGHFSDDAQESPLKIIGGVDVSANEVISKATVVLVDVRPTKQEAFCSGTLIAENVVLTASHCVEEILHPPDIPAEYKRECPGDYSPIDMRVGFGPKALIGKAVIEDPFEAADPSRKYKLNPELKLAKVRKIEMHPDYNLMELGDPSASPKVANDIALIFLADKAPPDAIIMPILSNRSALTSGKRVTVAGYGVTYGQVRFYNDGTKCEAPMGLVKYGEGHGTLRKKTINLRSVRNGGADGGAELVLDEGTCWGDSGGPTFITVGKQSYVIGASSRSEGNAKEDEETFKKLERGDFKVVARACVGNNIYTDASSFAGWINQKLKANIGKTLADIRVGKVDPSSSSSSTGSTSGNEGGGESPGGSTGTGQCPDSVDATFSCKISSGCAAYAQLGKESIGKVKAGTSFDVKNHACQKSTRDIWVQVSSSRGDVWIVSGLKY